MDFFMDVVRGLKKAYTKYARIIIDSAVITLLAITARASEVFTKCSKLQ